MYRVHIYAVVRIPVEVEAETHKEAMQAATEACDFDALLNHGEFEYADELTGYLVDPLLPDGEVDYEATRGYDAEMDDKGVKP